MEESEEELKSLLMKVKEESKKAGLKLNIQKTKIMTSGPITSRQIDGETMETVSAFIFLSSKITADGDCSHKIKRHLLLGRKAKTKLDSMLQSRDITLPTNVHLVKVMVFPVVMYGCESWAIKKAECQRIDAFGLWCWRTLRVPWTARRSNQSILKEISHEYSLQPRRQWHPTPVLLPGKSYGWRSLVGSMGSMGSHRVRHDWETSLSPFTFMHWRRKWQPTPVFLPGEPQG